MTAREEGMVRLLGLSLEEMVQKTGLSMEGIRARIRRGWGPDLVLRRGRKNDWVSRFWSKVEKTGDCWLWRAGLNQGGYGKFGVAAGDIRQAHRVAWELTNGPIGPGLLVCHHCDNPPCVRPDHLFLGTNAENMADMRRKRRHSHGPRHSEMSRRINSARPVHWKAKLGVESVREILALGGTDTADRIGERFGVSGATVRLILKGETWRQVPR